MDRFSFLNAAHTAFFADLYEQYLQNPDSVEPSWRSFFQGFDFAQANYGSEEVGQIIASGDYSCEHVTEKLQKEFNVLKLIEGYRTRGHLFTKTNPVRERRAYSPTLALENFGLSQADLNTVFDAAKIVNMKPSTLAEIVKHLESVYCSSIGVEFMYIREPKVQDWIKNRLDINDNQPNFSGDVKKNILRILMNDYMKYRWFGLYDYIRLNQGLVWLADYGHQLLPQGALTNLLIDGVLAGLSGVMIFIPQIALLFAFISVLEDTGYMSRVTFMMDRLMRKVGLNGKSVVPLIGGLACAVPSIMSARTIENWKERMITIMVTPLVSCSARLPIYTLLISLVVPKTYVLGFINLQGLALMSLYLMSIIMAVLVAWVMKGIIKSKIKGYFIMELPVYRMPRWNNVGITMYESVKTFVTEAGKVIIAVSIVLWVLASYGPSDRFEKIDQKYQKLEAENALPQADLDRMISSEKLEASYAGVLGKSIEPAIKPLGFDWKIGIALITSFAAREVFVGTMATLYAVDGDDTKMESVREKMANAKNTETGLPVFTVATSFSLMLFYAFAMQCMSTMAVVYRETKNMKWPLIQFAYMLVLAYVASFVVFQMLK